MKSSLLIVLALVACSKPRPPAAPNLAPAPSRPAALAMAPHRIRVNAISPGVINTPMRTGVDALFAKYENLPIGEKKKQVGRAVPLGYMGEPADICGAAVFLASDESSYITAQTLNVDGGNVMG